MSGKKLIEVGDSSLAAECKEDYPFSNVCHSIFLCHPEDVSPKNLLLNSIKITNFSLTRLNTLFSKPAFMEIL